MTSADVERGGVRHLERLARWPRPAGGEAETAARQYASSVLGGLGFTVREERFSYSAFPGRYATPIAGGVLGVMVVAACALALRGAATAAAGVLLMGAASTALFARWMLADAVLTLPWLRADGVNLAATRGAAQPKVWLVAHLDSKSQPVPSVVRMAGVAVLALALTMAATAVLLTLVGLPARMLWWGALVSGVAGACPVLASVVGAQSNGAVDNASGVAAVLAAAARLGPGVACGVLLPSAEELGLAGARAWARAHTASIALNCDGVDDAGALVIMYNTPVPSDVIGAVRGAAAAHAGGVGVARVRRMPLGLLTDSTALAAGGWRTVTVSYGSLATLRRVHTPDDSLDNLRGASIDDIADILARAAEALAT